MNINRDKFLTDEEALKYSKIREEIKEELPELINKHLERLKLKENNEIIQDTKQ